jgi:hypothetical protein
MAMVLPRHGLRPGLPKSFGAATPKESAGTGAGATRQARLRSERNSSRRGTCGGGPPERVRRGTDALASKLRQAGGRQVGHGRLVEDECHFLRRANLDVRRPALRRHAPQRRLRCSRGGPRRLRGRSAPVPRSASGAVGRGRPEPIREAVLEPAGLRGIRRPELGGPQARGAHGDRHGHGHAQYETALGQAWAAGASALATTLQ